MAVIWTKNSLYQPDEYASETELELAILEVQAELFGPNRLYLDIKKKIGLKGGQRNIPDGYLIDLSTRTPRLYVVENELAAHDPLRHIAVQILQFSLSFESEPHTVKKILLEAVQNQPSTKSRCERYALTCGFRGLDHLLETLVFDSAFAALVIIDRMPDNLENILVRKFQFGVEVLELARYKNAQAEHFYTFEPFLADVDADLNRVQETIVSKTSSPDLGEVDTVVVPAREDGVREEFLGNNRWYAIRIHGTMRPQIKYIAVYQVAPISAITYIAPVQSIEPWNDTGKFVVNFTERPTEIGPIQMVRGGRIKSFQNLRYTTYQKLENAKTLDDIW